MIDRSIAATIHVPPGFAVEVLLFYLKEEIWYMSTTTVNKETVIPEEIARAVTLPEAYSDLYGTTLPAMKWLRENAPVAKISVEGYDPYWFLAEHSTNLEVLRNQDLFHNAGANIMLQPKAGDEFLRDAFGGHTRVLENLSYLEPPEHGLYRNTIAHAFLPNAIRQYEALYRTLAKEAVDRLFDEHPDGEADFIQAIGRSYPLLTIMDMMNIPRSDFDLMLQLTQETFGGDDPDWRREDVPATPEAFALMWKDSIKRFYEHFLEVVRDRRANPGDDIATTIALSKMPSGELMPELMQVNLTMTLGFAGHDTVNSAITGGIHGLATHPDQLELVRESPKLVNGLVEEALRWATPAKHFTRDATADTVLNGIEIKKGDRLMCSFQAANRDPKVFRNPDTFDITRRPNPHLSFSFGPHVCLGQHIAKIEMRVLFEEITSRVKSLELNGIPRIKQANFVGGFKTMPIKFTKA